ncbi:MAG: response regulator [Alphaproteobacteria bacterium]|nr:response regulator [Alphaproteobacteria bacterium]
MRSPDKSDYSVSLGLTAVILFFIGSVFVSYMNTTILNRNTILVSQTHEVLIGIETLQSLLKDAETSQRGYVLSGKPEYLEPYYAALPKISQKADEVERALEKMTGTTGRLERARQHIDAKLAELKHAIDLRKTRGFEEALASVLTDKGKNEMVALQAELEAIEREQKEIRSARLIERTESYRTAITSGLLAGGLGVVLAVIVGLMIRRAVAARRREEWLQSGQAGLSTAMLGDQNVEELGNNILKFLAMYLDARAAVMYIKEGAIHHRTATYGVPAGANIPEQFLPGDGLLGQAIIDKVPVFVNNVPENYLVFGSALGQSTPRYLAISPALADEQVNAVVEFGFVEKPSAEVLKLLDQASEAIGIAVRSANYRAHLQNLLEETQRQSEELQAQSEELRVSNEELEEQSRALKESQVRLEQQQAELEQTNSQLEEQTQILETQRDDIARAQTALQQRARELELASQYKSDFLANMSHELRTPLNSTLILAKLLADNDDGNLTEEQVQFAETIQASGNDLLGLINDILDLSKIEAGHMEIRPERVSIKKLMDDMSRSFGPLAQQKQIGFTLNAEKDVPQSIETDGKRLEQIVKNLLSNAVKFTEKGEVSMNISVEHTGIKFAVKDTGIGIAPEQHEVIFEAFRQADGTTNRKYGGTGLGLSISRELTRLLGGMLTLESKVGEGSTFTIHMPLQYSAQHVSDAKKRRASDYSETVEDMPEYKPLPKGTRAPRKAAFHDIEDDRDKLTTKKKTLLIVEDDLAFARILHDLAHEQDFQCLVATTADEAVDMAEEYLPSAVLLDVGLPDHSGLSVLDRMKQNSRTRHIPVHIISMNDHADTAYSLGAAGYLLKPVKREDLADALKQLEQKLVHRMRNVLVVEDDPVQLESLRKLLASQDVQTVGAATAADCLKLLKERVFDCMVLDLTLPDASGYALLETLSKEEAYSFPPVIVYTGQDLSSADEQQLRRYSKSIIIKGVKSPERLLDEVTLFLHQVVSDLPPEQQRMLKKAKSRDAALEGRRILIVEDDVRNIYSITNILEPRGAVVQIARNGKEALTALEDSRVDPAKQIDLVLMDVMMPEMDGITATKEIRKKAEWKKLPILMLTAKAMRDDQERCLEAGANDYMAKPLDVDKLLSLIRVWMPR